MSCDTVRTLPPQPHTDPSAPYTSPNARPHTLPSLLRSRKTQLTTTLRPNPLQAHLSRSPTKVIECAMHTADRGGRERKTDAKPEVEIKMRSGERRDGEEGANEQEACAGG